MLRTGDLRRAAVDREIRAGNVGRETAGQETGDSRNLLGLTWPLQPDRPLVNLGMNDE